jgi:hypothetical protein
LSCWLHRKGANGGRQVDAGDYHVEMVAKDTSLAVYLNDDNDKPVEAKGYKVTGIFVVGGKPQRIELKPESVCARKVPVRNITDSTHAAGVAVHRSQTPGTLGGRLPHQARWWNCDSPLRLILHANCGRHD